MFNSLLGRTLTAQDPPQGAPHHRSRRRVGSLLAVASALALGGAMAAAPQPAAALSVIDGQWTVSHGGTGQVSLNTDGTYTSTCQVTPGYADAWCPPPAGTFRYSTMGSAGVTFTGADGSTTRYRVSGNVYSPDTITSYFGSRTQTPLIMKKGTEFVCTDWTVGKGTPMASVDETGKLLYATGSHDLLGPTFAGADVAETAPNYFQLGQCGNLYPKRTMASFLHIDTFRDATKAATPRKTWSPRVAVTIKDLAGVPVRGATVSGLFTPDQARFSCVTLADGTCTVGHSPLRNSVTSTEIWVGSVDKPGTVFWQDPGDDPGVPSPVFFTVYNPRVGPPSLPPPLPPVTHHVSDLDASAFGNAETWEPQVTVSIVDSDGYIGYHATVTGTFSHHSGAVTCITDGRGACRLGGFTLNRSTKTTVFTVTDVTSASSTYAPSKNSDPDGDSDGTSITANEVMVDRP